MPNNIIIKKNKIINNIKENNENKIIRNSVFIYF